MWTASVSPDEALAINSAGAIQRPRISSAPEIDDEPNEWEFGEGFGAGFLNDHATGNLLLEGYRQGMRMHEEDDLPDPEFNQYTYLKENIDKETLNRLAPFISEGEFDDVSSPTQARNRVMDLMRELEVREDMANNPGAAFMGSMAAAVSDPIGYLPWVGMGKKAKNLSTTSKFLLDATTSAAATELALQSVQKIRPFEESVANIMTAGAFGGGLGMAVSPVPRGSRLHPSHPENPFRSENVHNIPTWVRRVDGKIDRMTPEEMAQARDDYATGTAGAAKADDLVDYTIARKEPKTALGAALRNAGEVFNRVTPQGRIFRSNSRAARVLGGMLTDPGGVLFKHNLAGIANKKSAYAMKQDYMAEVETLEASFNQRERKLLQTISDMDTSLKQQNVKVRQLEGDLDNLTQRTLFDLEDEALERALEQRYGSAVTEEIRKAAKANAEEIHAHNQRWEDRLIEEGMVRNDQKVGELQAKLDQARADRDTAKEAGDESTISKARKDVENYQAQLQREKSKPKPLGREYGHAQMYDIDQILRNPNAFKSWLRDALRFDPTDEWLAQYESDLFPNGLTKDEFLDLRQTDRASYDQILEEWSGEGRDFQLAQAEERLAAAERAQKDANTNLLDVFRRIRLAKKKEAKLTLKQARARRDRLAQEHERLRQAQAERKAEGRALKSGADTARRQGNLKRRPSKSEGKAFDIEEQLSVENRTKTSQDDVPTARRSSQARERAEQLKREETRLKKIEEKLAKANEALESADAAAKQVSDARRYLQESASDARGTKKLADKEARKAAREAARQRKSVPLEEAVEDVYSSLTARHQMPSGILDRLNLEDSDLTTGRVKERGIRLHKAAHQDGINKGFLRSDLRQILYRQTDQLAAEVGLRKAVGYGEGRRYGSWGEVLDEIHTEYSDLRSQAEADGNTELAKALVGEEKTIVDDLVHIRDEVKRSVLQQDPTTAGWMNWASRKAREINTARFGGSFLTSSQTDLAAVHLRHGNVFKLLKRHARKSGQLMKNMKENPSDIERMISATEIGQGVTATARRLGNEDIVDAHFGIGSGRTREVTSKIDQGMDYATRTVMKYSGLPLWNRFWKTVSSLEMTNKLDDMVRRYDSLSQREVADLASLGIGRKEANRIRGFMDKHREVTETGHIDPHFEKWGDSKDAQEAYRDFRLAIQRDQNLAIMTPAAGERPRLMSHFLGAAWQQFMTFAYAFNSRFMYPALQRTSLFQDRQAMQAFGLLLATSAWVVALKDMQRGKDPSERYTEGKALETSYELLDRSGALTWTSPYVASALNLTSPFTGYGGASRYRSNYAFEPVAGVNAALFGDLNAAAGAIVNMEGDSESVERAIDKSVNLVPFGSQIRIMKTLALE